MANKKVKQEEVKSVNLFRCGHHDCKECEEMVFEEFKHHLFSIHNLKHDQLKGKKQMMCHIDGAEWFSSTYKWTLETGLEFHQFVQMPRAKDDMMRYM